MAERHSKATGTTAIATEIVSSPGAPRLGCWRVIRLCLGVLLATGLIEWAMGRSLLGPDGHFGWWEGSIYSRECSQRLADAYSFSHIVHGMLFYWGLWVVGRKEPLRYRLLAAVLIEAGWEVLENSPIIIDRYRQTALALGYNGDSVLNSLSDVVMMLGGFLVARSMRVWQTIVLLVLMEVGCAFWIRDNLTLNIVTLVHPVKAIERWQTNGRPSGARGPDRPAPEGPLRE